MKKLLLFFIGLCIVSSTFAQKDTPAQLLEGGRIVLEAIRLFKPHQRKVKEERDCTLSLCFDNQTEERIKIFIQSILLEEEESLIEIYSSAGHQDCSYSITAGIYSYEIQSEEGDILRKAEVNVKACRAVLIEVKE